MSPLAAALRNRWLSREQYDFALGLLDNEAEFKRRLALLEPPKLRRPLLELLQGRCSIPDFGAEISLVKHKHIEGRKALGIYHLCRALDDLRDIKP